ncbi:MAG TPA: NAD(P)/FAD-dependent oxidoreductase [Anaerolineae bacterium]|nr:NAD(P)/FAD-dependent oxidoreductase [Anaerolineae bacterium]
MFDAIVIGAGPAGSVAARRLASDGWQVALLEKSDDPGQDNVCGGMLSLPMVKKFGVFPDAVEKVMRSELHVLPWGVIENATVQCTVQRRVFDHLLAQRAVAAGAELMTRAQARAVRVVAPAQVEVEVQRRASSQSTILRGRGLILADGPRTLARSLGLGYRPSDGVVAFALACELAWPGNGMDHYELYYGEGVARWGYAWVFPYRDVLSVGLGCILSELRGRSSLKRDLLDFIHHHPRASLMLSDKTVVRRRGGWIPLCAARNMVGSSTLVVGDAAGLAHPLIAAGIDNALESGDLAGRVMSEALAAGDLSAGFLARFQYEWQRTPASRFMRVQNWIARIGQALSHLDRNMMAKVVQLALLGGTLTWPGKLQALGYPWFGTPRWLPVH